MTVAPFVPGRTALGSDDAVRTNLDMLPNGVSRTDGTGSRLSSPSSIVPAPLPAPGYTGGTTPTCALQPFGRRVGEQAPALPRALADFHGANAVGETPSFVFTRPPVTGVVLATFLQFGFPGVPSAGGPVPLLYFDTEFWMLDPSAVSLLALSPGAYFGQIGTSWFYQGYQAFRFTLTTPLLSGTSPMTAQLVTLAACDASWPCTGCDQGFIFVASPALSLEY